MQVIFKMSVSVNAVSNVFMSLVYCITMVLAHSACLDRTQPSEEDVVFRRFYQLLSWLILSGQFAQIGDILINNYH